MSKITNTIIDLTLEQQKMCIGTLVTTKRIGLPTVGQIIGMATFPLFVKLTGLSYSSTYIFENDYPDFRQKLMMCILYKTPQKSLTFEEFKYRYEKWNKSDTWLKTHYEDMSKEPINWYPIDDLEIYDIECSENWITFYNLNNEEKQYDDNSDIG